MRRSTQGPKSSLPQRSAHSWANAPPEVIGFDDLDESVAGPDQAEEATVRFVVRRLGPKTTATWIAQERLGDETVGDLPESDETLGL